MKDKQKEKKEISVRKSQIGKGIKMRVRMFPLAKCKCFRMPKAERGEGRRLRRQKAMRK